MIRGRSPRMRPAFSSEQASLDANVSVTSHPDSRLHWDSPLAAARVTRISCDLPGLLSIEADGPQLQGRLSSLRPS
jgi:hypothetical protein